MTRVEAKTTPRAAGTPASRPVTNIAGMKTANWEILEADALPRNNISEARAILASAMPKAAAE
jgi:hypothetical protein